MLKALRYALTASVATVPFAANLAFTQTAFAQTAEAASAQSASSESVGEILVTAQRRTENLQSVPVAVSVISQEQMEATGSFDPADIGRAAVGVISNTFGADRTNVVYSIRGQNYATGTLFPAVQPYFEEVPLSKLYVGTFFDLENIQVLRGPQGTLFGRVTDGGNILLAPARPKDKWEGNVELKGGSYNLRSVSGMLNVPLVEGKVALRGAVEVTRRQGFTKNIAQSEHLDGLHYESYRLGLLLTPFDGLENYTVANYTHGDETGGSQQMFYVNPAAAGALAADYLAGLALQEQLGPRKVASDYDNFEIRKQLILVNKTDLEITDNLGARLVLGFTYMRQKSGGDTDGTLVPRGGALQHAFPQSLTYQRHFSADFTLNGTLLDDKLDWTVGTYVDRQETPGKAEQSGTIGNLERSVFQDVTTTSTAFFGQASYDMSSLVQGLKATGGVRHTSDTAYARTAYYFAFVQEPDLIPHGLCLDVLPPGLLLPGIVSKPCNEANSKFKQTTWMANLEWQASDSLFLYAKISKGYRPGGFNTSTSGEGYLPETVVSKEIGFKSDWTVAGRPVRLNVAGFYDDFKDIQRLITLENAAATANINSAVVKGIEAEATLVPFEGFQIDLRYSLLRAKYSLKGYSDDYIRRACPADPRTQANDTTTFCPLGAFSRVPRNQFGVTARYSVPIEESTFSIGGDWYFVSKQYTNAQTWLIPESLIEGYDVLNVDAGISNIGGSGADVRLFATNVLNKVYTGGVVGLSNFGLNGFSTRTLGPPRMIGVSLRMNFGAD